MQLTLGSGDVSWSRLSSFFSGKYSAAATMNNLYSKLHPIIGPDDAASYPRRAMQDRAGVREDR